MHFHIVSLFPESFDSYLATSIMRIAREKGAVEFLYYSPADFTGQRSRRSDGRPYGGGAGTVLRVEPLYRTITHIEETIGYSLPKILLSPRGPVLSQKTLQKFAKTAKDYIVICGHYEGVDQRIIDYFDIREVSIGRYVLSSGEIAAMVLIDGIVRLLPGVISGESLHEESYSEALGGKREYPQYARPETFLGHDVPAVLLSGDHRAIATWRRDHRR